MTYLCAFPLEAVVLIELTHAQLAHRKFDMEKRYNQGKLTSHTVHKYMAAWSSLNTSNPSYPNPILQSLEQKCPVETAPDK